ncbi:MAG: hypothetical protein ACPL3C_01080 [Pyrobaculum sp.]|uniref:hypothetical protein n=1 Tax=Pyrobaculum sp. TaxID=2004705 RepID=UPI003C9A609A
MAPQAASLSRWLITELTPFFGTFSLFSARFFPYAPTLLAAAPLSAYGFAVALIASPIIGSPRWLSLVHLLVPYLSIFIGIGGWYFLLFWLIYLVAYLLILPAFRIRPRRLFYKPFFISMILITPLSAIPYTAGLVVSPNFLAHLGIPPEYARLSWIRYIHDVILLRFAFYYIERYMKRHGK